MEFRLAPADGICIQKTVMSRVSQVRSLALFARNVGLGTVKETAAWFCHAQESFR